jgi:subtilisin family serine protease
MLNKSNKKLLFLFLIAGIFLLIFMNYVSAESITVSPSVITQGDTATISIDSGQYDPYVYFYKGDSYVTAGSIGCSGTCSEAKTFIYTFNSETFSSGSYRIHVYSTSENKWLETNFEIVEPSCSDGTAPRQCSSTKPKYCDNGNLIDKCLTCNCPKGQRCQVEGSCLDTGDTDGDGIPDIHDPDADGDNIMDLPYASINANDDMDNDGIININDDDIDGDGILNGFDVAFAFSGSLNIILETIPQEITEGTPLVLGAGEVFLQSAPFNGYIVELQEESLLVQRQNLETNAKINDDRFIARILARILPRSIAPVVSGNIEAKTEDAKGNLENKREEFKEKARNALDKKEIVIATGNAVTENTEEDLIVTREFENVFNGVALNITTEEAKEIKKINGVKKVYPNYIVNITLADSVPLINADDVWQLDASGNDCTTSGQQCLTGQGVRIGIIDTGVDYTHEDLGGCLGANCKVVGGWDFVNNDNDPIDDMGHGTHVAATAAGNGVLKGVAPDAEIYAYKVLDSSGGGSSDNIIAAIERATDPNQDGDFSDHLDIISLSLGGPGNPDDPMSTAIDNAVNSGVVAVVAAGNDGPNEQTIRSPGTARKAITVGATDKSDSIAYFSSRGPVVWTDFQRNENYLIKPDVVAPGISVCAAQSSNKPWSNKQCLDDKHIAISGTSMATPHVAGAVALIKQAHPDWTPDEIKMALRNTAVNLGENVNTQGYGRIDVLNTVNLQGIPTIAKIETGEKVYGTIDIMGSASGREFNRYTLYYGVGENPSQWVELITSTTPIENGILYSNFDTSLLEEGTYYLKLIVENNNGDKSEDKDIMKINNIEITSPWDRSILRRGDIIEIKGRASEFNQISIKYSQGLYFNIEELKDAIWKTDNLEVNTAYNGEGVLARWDTSSLEEDFYNLKIETENSQEFIYPIFLDSKLKEGWPIYLNSYDTFLASELYQPEVQDLDGDNKKEIIFVYRAGQDTFNQIAQLIVYNSDGSIKWSKELPSPLSWEPCNKVVGDVDNDGFSEIFVECTTQQFCSQKLYGFKHNGDKYGGAEWPLSLEGCDPYTLSIADLNSDGINELIAYGGERVIIPEEDIRKIALFIGANGILKEILVPACSFLGTDQDYASGASVGNFDEDKNLEVAVKYGCNGVGIYNFDGSSVNGWPVYVDGFIWGGQFSTGDINADGNQEIIVPTVYLRDNSNGEVYNGGIYALNRNGALLPGWPFNESKSFTAPVALADLDGDKKLEIIAQADDGSKKFILKYNGEKFSGWPPQIQPTVGTMPVRSAPVAADLDGDNKIDAIFKDGGFTAQIYDGRIDALGGVLAYNLEGNPIDLNMKYNQIEALLLEFWPSYATTIITDLEENGKIDLISTSKVSTLNKNVVALYVHELDFPYDPATMEWPMFQHDPQHTGMYKEINCTDSDWGIDYHAKGYVSTNYNGQNPNNFVYDSCIIPDPRQANQGIGTISCFGEDCQVLDYYCIGDAGPYGSFFSCPDGCNDGICMSAPTVTTIQVTCTDSDGGINYNVKGYINTNVPSWEPNFPDKCALLVAPGNYEDQNSCTGEKCFLVELYCDSQGYPANAPNRVFYNCPNGCNDGACV